jgi:acetoin utilization protein AcuB
MRANEIMTANPMTISDRATAREALELLQTLEVRHLPVVRSSGELVGVLSDRDLGGSRAPFTVDGGAPNRAVTELMTAEPLTVDPEAEVSEVVDLMLENRVGAVPVVDPTSNELLGIVSYVDVLRAVRDQV